eukprot:TRINITY_DN11604_c0_g1_i1.p1 TRINITY_DN11604_c0_g1~~TRINITY_DN11604_c0_g1_i1.p1  ORF type:complete len:635 (-),score=99.85 TRINITY_DN11604_c0_g1_i1:179-2083(-)
MNVEVLDSQALPIIRNTADEKKAEEEQRPKEEEEVSKKRKIQTRSSIRPAEVPATSPTSPSVSPATTRSKETGWQFVKADSALLKTVNTSTLKRPSFRLIEQMNAKDDPPQKIAAWRTDAYIRWKPPDEESVRMPQYDADTDDERWIQEMNQTNPSFVRYPLNVDAFESVLDTFEHEDFQLAMNTCSKISDEDEDIYMMCAVCNREDSDDTNLIVFCDGCNLAVHQECYGIELVPEGIWLCHVCQNGSSPSLQTCILCGGSNGPMKPTTTGRWAHVLCSLWVPGVCIPNIERMEPIDISNIVPERWKLTCYLCKSRFGACIQCSKRECAVAYHPTCAFMKGHYLVLGEDLTHLTNLSYCTRHTPRSHTMEDATHEVYTMPKGQDGSEPNENSVNRTAQDTPQNGHIRRKHSFTLLPLQRAQKICRLDNEASMAIYSYWIAKREQRKAPLLRKYRHAVIPAKGSRQNVEKTHQELVSEFNALRKIRTQLEKVRLCLELIRKREAKKREIVRCICLTIECQTDPLSYRIRNFIKLLESFDTLGYFREPVSISIARDYYDVIKNPMDFSTMKKKLDAGLYDSITAAKGDVDLICNNATTYNASKSRYAVMARSLQKYANALISESQFADEAITAIDT